MRLFNTNTTDSPNDRVEKALLEKLRAAIEREDIAAVEAWCDCYAVYMNATYTEDEY